ncbi:unnamed protein product (macronuclear) [Paramecium tetraurelia]|uniref:Uncharacterized protein n=1 Tax=Paramecium tetraurelia TaxID=5888 RepID=A0BII8_PARTE|nr:uncharacterized protein GSPATT00004727001 [Paramecium tetraurelia]CAK58355.1 unnamed protein product [Paramecium tetraurelia]|eukprot:XP_001425753.1 hypothetical protein (macronuclear) [Paramecium tetraurelia strain d4-2]
MLNLKIHFKIRFYEDEFNDYEYLEIDRYPKIEDYYTYGSVVVINIKGYENFTRNSYDNEMEIKVIEELYKDMKNYKSVQPAGLVDYQIIKKIKEENVEVKTTRKEKP